MKHRDFVRPLTCLLLSALAVALVWRDRVVRTSAADSETITWGASDPTWSPDGPDVSRLAFSLFGSIWQVAAAGGPAEQVTTSAGYHAYPAWSPKGGRIVFVRGDAPAGSIPRISGRLVLVDLATGIEQELPTPQPTAGTPAWSPDGTRIVCALRMPNGAGLLHEITVAGPERYAPGGGHVRQIQFNRQVATVGGWVDAAWSPRNTPETAQRGGELFFAAQRGPAPQVWTMPAGGPPIMIQLPLTRYRAEDIVFLHSLSALPDGSGAVYSAVHVNGKGDYELYRVPRQGGAPVAITNTTRDEFSPAVSPDGKTIAHVANDLGNIDLFTMPVGGGEKRHVRITELKFRRPAGQVRVKVLDEFGQPTAVRLYVRAGDGKAYCPAGSPIFYYPLDPGVGREGFFVAGGENTFPVPAGPLRLVALKGIEYRPLERTVEVAPRGVTEVTLTMERWTNWNQRGWYTGENHFHANYGGSYYQRPRQSLDWLKAEDLNAANMIVANNAGAFIHDKEFFRGAVDPLSTPRHLLYWGQEFRNSDPLGHMAFLNIQKQVPPSYTSVPGSNSSYDFPLNTMAALEARKQGGLVSYVHPMGGTSDVFDTWLGAKESPLTAALGGMDSIDILPFADAATELWYRLLNSGFKIAPGAGTDVFTNWRGINSIPGGARQYVEVGAELSWNRWIERYRQGRVFVTTGPLVSFEVNGQPMGSEIRIPAGQPYRARLAAEVVARAPLTRIEFIQNGNVVETREVQGQAGPVRLEREVTVDRSCWFAVRARGEMARGVVGGPPRAHSGPIYVHADGRPTLVREDIELMIRWVDRLWAYLEERNNFGPGDNRRRAQRVLQQAREHFQAKLNN